MSEGDIVDEDAYMWWEDDGGGAWQHPDALDEACDTRGLVADEDYWADAA